MIPDFLITLPIPNVDRQLLCELALFAWDRIGVTEEDARQYLRKKRITAERTDRVLACLLKYAAPDENGRYLFPDQRIKLQRYNRRRAAHPLKPRVPRPVAPPPPPKPEPIPEVAPEVKEKPKRVRKKKPVPVEAEPKEKVLQPHQRLVEMFKEQHDKQFEPPYIFVTADFIMVQALIKKCGEMNWPLTEERWQRAVQNYLNSPTTARTCKDLAQPERFSRFYQGTVDRYGRPSLGEPVGSEPKKPRIVV